MPSKSLARFPYVLVFVEGDTEVIFYERVKKKLLPKSRSKIINLGGNFSINHKVLDKATILLEAHSSTEFCVCVCIDRDSRSGKAPIDMDVIKKELSCYPNIQQDNILLFEAIQDIESWFFHDIKGIYAFLKYPTSKRKVKKFKTVEKLNHQDLSKLFKQAKSSYRKGYASTNFINKLNLQLIRDKSKVFNDFCQFIENIFG